MNDFEKCYPIRKRFNYFTFILINMETRHQSHVYVQLFISEPTEQNTSSTIVGLTFQGNMHQINVLIGLTFLILSKKRENSHHRIIKFDMKNEPNWLLIILRQNKSKLKNRGAITLLTQNVFSYPYRYVLLHSSMKVSLKK